MKKYLKISIVITVIGLVVAGLIYNYVFNAKHRDIASEKPEVTIKATDLITQFLNDESLATTLFLDKVLEIEGVITSYESNEVVLNEDIQIRFDSVIVNKTQVGTKIKVKGRCVGYDELLEMVKIDQATITN